MSRLRVPPTPASLPLDVSPTAAAEARRWLATELRRRGATSSQLHVDAALLVTELVANAVRHGAPPIVLVAVYEQPDLQLSVSDGGGPPYLFGTRAPDVTSTSGRGLAIVATLSTAWGTRRLQPGPGKTVWCRVRDAGVTATG